MTDEDLDGLDRIALGLPEASNPDKRLQVLGKLGGLVETNGGKP